jgi:sigma-B regulation protein RsbU (phosphoserine phosphatase)
VAGAVFWLALWFGLLWLLRQTPTPGRTLLGWMQVLVGIALIGLAAPLVWRLVNEHLLWSLRNKLILTYLLIGLAPVVLVVTFVTISVWVAAGQFSIHLADLRMRQELDELGVNNATRAGMMARMMRAREEGFIGQAPPRRSNVRPARAATPAAPEDTSAAAADASAASEATLSSEAPPDPLRARLHPHTAIYLNGASLPTLAGVPASIVAQNSMARTPLGFPAWAADLHGEQIRYLVLDGEDLYLVAIDQRTVEGSGIVTVITSLPIDGALVDVIAKGLGRVNLLTGVVTGDLLTAPADVPPDPEPSRPREITSGQIVRKGTRVASVHGGTEPISVYVYDFGVRFTSTLDTVDWETGKAAALPAVIEVHSRPSLLYRQLFGSSLGGVVTSAIRYGLIALCMLFALIEALALWMALRLSSDFTKSVGHSAGRPRRLHTSYSCSTPEAEGPAERAESFVQSYDRIARTTARRAAGEGAPAERALHCPGGAGQSLPPPCAQPAPVGVAWHLPPGAFGLRRLLRLSYLPSSESSGWLAGR